MGAGIDYGMGIANVDMATGIRYGVIHQNEVLQAWCDESEPVCFHGCPRCGAELPDGAEPVDGGDYVCAGCGGVFTEEDSYGDEPLGFRLDGGGYEACSDEYGDIFVTKSPYYTRARFCSPCAPGACYLMSQDEDGERAYCFGHDWFNGGKAPYRVWRVSDGEEVFP